MKKKELREFRKNFYMNLEETIKEKEKITKQDYNNILLDAMPKINSENKTDESVLVYMGSYAVDKYGITEEKREYLTYEKNPKVAYKLYKALGYNFYYKVDITKTVKFEKEHKIIFPKIDIYNIQEFDKQFNKIKLQYYRYLLYNKQKEAYKLVKKINEQK